MLFKFISYMYLLLHSFDITEMLPLPNFSIVYKLPPELKKEISLNDSLNLWSNSFHRNFPQNTLY